ncbi:hypothetical protein SBA3_2760021 [Candidatus Sulfopaludibacter sp. SbA3]|nr:hypothetical protein SBA3_2760021 [Candidatus Sulfopaludibacter sp. SbA3]
MNEPSEVRRIKLALLDDHGLFRESLGRLLAAEPDLEVVGEGANFAEALALLAASPVDMILLERRIGAERSDTFITAARQSGYRGKFFLVTGAINAAQSAAVLKVGARILIPAIRRSEFGWAYRTGAGCAEGVVGWPDQQENRHESRRVGVGHQGHSPAII